jgi:DNA-binding CsgD family transcriptional regulator
VKLRKKGLSKAVLAKQFKISPGSVTNYVKRSVRRKPKQK